MRELLNFRVIVPVLVALAIFTWVLIPMSKKSTTTTPTE